MGPNAIKLNILSLVFELICFAFQVVLNVRKTTLVSCILAFVFSSVPIILLVLLPMRVQESVPSSGSNPKMTGLLLHD